MNFRILGTSSGLPQPGKHLSGIYVDTGGQKFLFDCGDGISMRLSHYGVHKNDLDAVVICHFHPDHVAGIFMLVQTLYLEGRCKDLPIFVAERAAEFETFFSFFYTFPERLCYQVKVLPISEISQHYPCLKAHANDHLWGYQKVIQAGGYQNQMQSFSIKVSAPHGDFVYSSDLGTTDSIAPLLQGAHSAVVDGGHPAFEQLKSLKYHHIQRVLLTHGTPSDSLNTLLADPSGIFEEAREDCLYRI